MPGPFNFEVELCQECIEARTRIHGEGGTPPEIRLLEAGTWQDAPPLNFTVSGEKMTAQVKFLVDSENSGLVRARFNDKPQWFAAGVYGRNQSYALSDAKFFIRTYYFSHAPVEFSQTR